MTPEQRRVLTLPQNDSIREETLRVFGASDGVALSLELLRHAIAERDAVGVEVGLTVCFRFGFSRDHLRLLLELASADWHVRHEDVVSGLAELRAPEAIDALCRATQWVPEYLEFDDARALATKAIWALGDIRGDAARHALVQLSNDENEIVRDGAQAQLER